MTEDHPYWGMMTSFTIEVTMAPNAAPIITATARSSTLPFITKALNSFNNSWFPAFHLPLGEGACAICHIKQTKSSS